ncbi:MAG: NADH-quinone oxidoreductase subunit C [Methanospirillum sp.]
MSTDIPPVIQIQIPDLLAAVAGMKAERYRLVAISATTLGDDVQVDYTFDLDLRLRILRVVVSGGGDLPSITPVYFGAFAYENEIHDLFGLAVTGIALDFGGTFYRTAVKHAFGPAPKTEG